jgi:hypothetical protein
VLCNDALAPDLAEPEVDRAQHIRQHIQDAQAEPLLLLEFPCAVELTLLVPVLLATVVVLVVLPPLDEALLLAAEDEDEVVAPVVPSPEGLLPQAAWASRPLPMTRTL